MSDAARERLWKALEVVEFVDGVDVVTVQKADLGTVLRQSNREFALACAVRRVVADYERRST
jgi:hypothetical protein